MLALSEYHTVSHATQSTKVLVLRSIMLHAKMPLLMSWIKVGYNQSSCVAMLTLLCLGYRLGVFGSAMMTQYDDFSPIFNMILNILPQMGELSSKKSVLPA